MNIVFTVFGPSINKPKKRKAPEKVIYRGLIFLFQLSLPVSETGIQYTPDYWEANKEKWFKEHLGKLNHSVPLTEELSCITVGIVNSKEKPNVIS